MDDLYRGSPVPGLVEKPFGELVTRHRGVVVDDRDQFLLAPMLAAALEVGPRTRPQDGG